MDRKHKLGAEAEKLAARLLRRRGYSVDDLNVSRHANFPHVDLKASKGGVKFRVSVKARERRWHIGLGQESSLCKLRDDDWVIAFIPRKHKDSIDLRKNKYRVFIIPGFVARDEAMKMQHRYLSTPLKSGRRKGQLPSGNYGVVVKFDHCVGRDLFLDWQDRFEGRWDLLPNA